MSTRTQNDRDCFGSRHIDLNQKLYLVCMRPSSLLWELVDVIDGYNHVYVEKF